VEGQKMRETEEDRTGDRIGMKWTGRSRINTQGAIYRRGRVKGGGRSRPRVLQQRESDDASSFSLSLASSPPLLFLSHSLSLSHLVHRGAPEVIVENILEGRVGPEVAVVLDRRDVVEDEAAAEAVEVHGERGYRHDRRECSPRRHSHYK